MKINKTILILLLLMITDYSVNSYHRKVEYVPNSSTAIKIAEIIWLPIYGNSILKEKPFVAKLIKNGTVWLVRTTLPDNMVGGECYIEIMKKDCKVLKVWNEK